MSASFVREALELFNDDLNEQSILTNMFICDTYATY